MDHQINGAKEPGKPLLLLAGLGLDFPHQATLEVMRALSGCHTIFSNLSGPQATEFLNLFCRDVRPVSYQGEQDEGRWISEILSGARKGRVVAFVTRGHPLVSGNLAHQLMQGAKAAGIPVRNFSAISSIDALLAATGESLSVSQRGLQAYDSDLLTRGRVAAQAQVPLIVYLRVERNWGRRRRDRHLADLAGALSRCYGEAAPAFLFGPRYETNRLERTRVGDLQKRLAAVATDLLSSIIIYVPPRRRG